MPESILSTKVPKSIGGHFNSLVTLSGSISRIIGPPVIGLVITGLGIRQVWLFIFFISLIAAGLTYSIYFCEKNQMK